MNWALTGLGLLLVAEGLVWALAPGMIEDLLAAMRTLTPEQRRLIGLGAVALGAALLWLVRVPA